MLGLGVLVLVFIATPVHAQTRPIQITIIAPIQIFPEDNPIAGIRLNLIYGRNVSVTGLDAGLVNHTTTGMFKGVQFGFVGLADSEFIGWQNN